MKLIAFVLTLLGTPSLAEVIEYTCGFDRMSSPDEGLKPAEKGFSMSFRHDTVTGAAFMRGNAGLASVHPVLGEQGLTFLEALGSGAVQTTSIDSNGGAVHSRHTMILGELLPSQFYGQCEWTQK